MFSSLMHRLLVAPLSCIALCVCAQGTQKAEIVDAAGFAQPMTAATAELPTGWRTQGGVSWNRGTNCVTNQVRLEWQARSRDDLQAFEIMPGYNWQVQGTQVQMNPCTPQPFRSAREFLEAVVQQRRAGARVLQYRDRPDIAAANAVPANLQAMARVDSGQLLIAYQRNGVEFREVLGTTVTFFEARGNIVGGTSMVFAHRAPAGQLDFAVAERLATSFRLDPTWNDKAGASVAAAEKRFSTAQSEAIARWHAAQMAAINARGEADRAAIRSAASRDIANIYSAINRNTQTTNDNIHRRTLEGIGEYNTYQDGNGTQVNSSIHGGDRVLRQPNGTYMSTNDPYFNPAGSRELQRVR